MRKFYWYLTAYTKKYGITFFLSVLGAILIFSFIVPRVASSMEKSNRQYIGLIGEYTFVNLPDVITHQLSAGLTQIKEDGSVEPLLAERWTIEQDGKTYRFVLKDNIYWQDGTPLRPEDINFNLSEVETIITPNDIVFKLPDAYAPFPGVVSQPLFKSGRMSHYFFMDRPSLVGIGEYRITDYELRGQHLSKITIDGNSERFVYKFYLTEQDAVTAFKKGEVDILPELAGHYDIMDWPTTQVTETVATNRYLAVFFNIRTPLFNKNVRQALSYALDKAPEEVRAYGPINPKSWAYLEGAKTYEKDWERGVERLLAEIPPEPLGFELTTTALFQKEAEEIKNQWETFGEKAYQDCQTSSAVDDKSTCENAKINVKIRISNFPDTSNFQVLLVGQESPSDPDQYHLWHSEQSTNFTGYKNTRIDNLLEQGRQNFNQQERTEIYEEFQQFFLEDAPAVFIKYLTNYEVRRK